MAQIHDELILEVNSGEGFVEVVAQALRSTMEDVVTLAVPLRVNIKVGERWGSLRALES